jgi:hypothetical protein
VSQSRARRKRSTVFAAVLSVGALAFSVVGALPAAANPGSCGTRSNYFDGYRTSATVNTWGTRAIIVNQIGFNCLGDTTHNNFNTDWVMFGFDGNPGYAQVGIFEYVDSGGMKYFSEYDQTGQAFTRKVLASPTPPLGSQTLYTVLWSADCTCEQMYYGLSRIDSTNFNPLSQGSLQNLYDSEATYRESDIPGGPTTAAADEVLQVQIPLTYTWRTPDTLSPDHDTSRWYLGPYYDNGFVTYTINP